MKNILKLAVFAVFMTFPQLSYAVENAQVVLDLKPETEEKAPAVGLLLDEYLAEVADFDAKYPGEQVEEDFKDDIRELHPEYGDSGINTKETLIRLGVRTKRIYNFLLEKVKSFIATSDIPLILPESAYESGDEETYIESDAPVVIQDFKKIIAYSRSERDRRAYQDKQRREQGGLRQSERDEELKKAFLQGDWKKVFSYGLFDGREIEDRRGIGVWDTQGKLFARLLASQKTLADGYVEGALQLALPRGYLILAEGFEQYAGLSLNFNSSGVLPEFPLPRRYNFNKKSLIAYTGSVVIPFRLKVDAAQPLMLQAELKAVVCGENKCFSEVVTPVLELRPGAAEESTVASFLRMNAKLMPQEQHEELEIRHLVVEKSVRSEDADVLRAELRAKSTPADFDIFIRSAAGIKFAPPLISINGRDIVARFKAVEPGTDLLGQEFEVSARLTGDVAVRKLLKAEDASLFDLQGNRLSVGLLWLGFVGGFLLNLMPCVFPVLSLKLLSFTRFGRMKTSEVRRSFGLNLLGIYCSFALLALGLITLKLLGAAVGWGMQFQNVYFLTFMIFVIAAFCAHVWGLVSFRTPHFVDAVLEDKGRKGDLLHFLTGLFLVLLSTPCTAPYLGTALGFALAGTPLDIALMMIAVALGLSLPYLLFVLFPGLAYYMPSPGPWMRRVNALMSIMLLLTLVWLLSILSAQTSAGVMSRFILWLTAFFIVLWFRRMLLQAVERQPETPEVLSKVRRIFNVAAAVLIGVLITAAAVDAGYGYYRSRGAETSALQKMISLQEVRENVNAGRIVLVRVGADWCLTCKLNDLNVFDTPQTIALLDAYNVVVLDVDWTNYNRDVLAFMEKFGRRGLPFYVVFAPRVPDGMVLPELISDKDFTALIENLAY